MSYVALRAGSSKQGKAFSYQHVFSTGRDIVSIVAVLSLTLLASIGASCVQAMYFLAPDSST